MSTPRLSLPSLRNAVEAWRTLNTGLAQLDVLVLLAVKDRDLATPPGSPANGDVYLVAASATDDWTGKEGQITYYSNGWLFAPPNEGWSVWVSDEDIALRYDGSAWIAKVEPVQMAAIAALAQTIGVVPSQAEVQAISSKVDALLAALRTAKLLAT